MSSPLSNRLNNMPSYQGIIGEIALHKFSSNCSGLSFFNKFFLEFHLSVKALETCLSKRFLTEFTYRKALAHLNSIPNTSHFPYESNHENIMRHYWNSILATLPADLIAQVGEQELIQLQNGYTEANLPSPQLAESIQKGELRILSSGFKRHCIELVFCKGYLLICNRGDRSDNTPTIQAFKINPELMTCEKLKELLGNNDANREEGLTYLYQTLPSTLQQSRDAVCEQLESLSGRDQEVGNCTSTSNKEALKAAFALLGLSQNPDGTAYIPEPHLKKANTVKKLLSAHARAAMLNHYCSPEALRSSNNNTLRDQELIKQCKGKTWLHLQQAGIDPNRYPHLPTVTPEEGKALLEEKKRNKEWHKEVEKAAAILKSLGINR